MRFWKNGAGILKRSNKPDLFVALMHYPVVNKNGDTIASAVTNLDLHDIARAARTYGINRFYVVTPLKDQKELVEKIVSHWVDGRGSTYNSIRKEALCLIEIVDSMEDVISDIRKRCKVLPKTVVTTARNKKKNITFCRLREILEDGLPKVLIFGTAWGLSEDFMSKADYVLNPLMGDSDYNHLSVRSAVSIILDRLMGDER